MTPTQIPITKTMINKIRIATDEVITNINGKTFNSNDDFKRFASELIYNKIETMYILGFNQGLLSSSLIIK